MQLASGLRAGGFSLPGSFSGFFREKQQLPLEDDGVFRPEFSRPPRKIDAQTTLVYNNYLYTGNPLKPQVGDIRISFWGNRSSHVSLIGKQQKPYFGSGRTILDAPTDAGAVSPRVSVADQNLGHSSPLPSPLLYIRFCVEMLAFPFFLVTILSACGPSSSLSIIFIDPYLQVWTRINTCILFSVSHCIHLCLSLVQGEPMTILAEGDFGPRGLVEHRLTELGFPASFVWTWRVTGFAILFSFVLSFNVWASKGSENDSTVR